MVPARPVHPAARAAEDRAVHGKHDRRAGVQEALHEKVEQQQAEAVRAPGGAGEEVVGAGVVQAAGEARRLPHPGDGVFADAAEEPRDERLEELEGGRGEGGLKQGQDRAERRWQGGHRRLPPRGRLDTPLVRASRRCSLLYLSLDVEGRSPSSQPEVTKVELNRFERDLRPRGTTPTPNALRAAKVDNGKILSPKSETATVIERF